MSVYLQGLATVGALPLKGLPILARFATIEKSLDLLRPVSSVTPFTEFRGRPEFFWQLILPCFGSFPVLFALVKVFLIIYRCCFLALHVLLLVFIVMLIAPVFRQIG